jgi:hypothetical protein
MRLLTGSTMELPERGIFYVDCSISAVPFLPRRAAMTAASTPGVFSPGTHSPVVNGPQALPVTHHFHEQECALERAPCFMLAFSGAQMTSMWEYKRMVTVDILPSVYETGFLTLTSEVPASSRLAFPGPIQVWSYSLSTGFGSDPASPAVRSQFCSFIANVVLVGGKRKREVRLVNTVMFFPLALRQRTHRNVIQLSRYDTCMVAQDRTNVNKTAAIRQRRFHPIQ